MEAKPRVPDAQVNIPKEHPLQEAGLLVVAGGGLAAAVFIFAAFFVELVVWALPPQLEADWLTPGDVLPEEFAATEVDPELSASLQGLLSDLAEHWEDNPYALRIKVIEEEDPNAFAVPGGWILVTTGLLEGAKSENEVAFVLAHEIGHFRNRDHLRGLGRRALLGLLLSSTGVYGTDSLIDATSVLLELRFGRGQEGDADRVALELVEAHYGHVNHSWDFFARMAKEASVAEVIPTFLRTHPASMARVDRLQRMAQARGYPLEGKVRPWPPAAALPDNHDPDMPEHAPGL